MCLIVFAHDCHPAYRLVLVANRDEHFDRPAAPAAVWPDAPQVVGGRDLVAGGTWLGITTSRRVAAVTNFRGGRRPPAGAPSRGRLPADFLTGSMSPEQYLETLRSEGESYGGFNLLFGDDGGLFYHSNRGNLPSRVDPGVHGLSNHLLDTPWPKVAAAKARLQRLIRDDAVEPEELFRLVGTTTRFADDMLPDTGVGIERERQLSSLFIVGTDYGTRSSTVILIHRDGTVAFQEKVFDGRQSVVATRGFRIETGGEVTVDERLTPHLRTEELK